MTAAKIAALVAVAILALTYSMRAGIGMWNHAHPERPHSYWPQPDDSDDGYRIPSAQDEGVPVR